jgi:hypothetical protein
MTGATASKLTMVDGKVIGVEFETPVKLLSHCCNVLLTPM